MPTRPHSQGDLTLDTLLLVGRDREQDALRRRLRQAEAGRGGLLLLAGEAGIGKTHLLDCTLPHAGTRVLRGPSRDAGLAAPYSPLAAALRAHLQVAPGALDHLPGREHLALLLPELGLSLPEGGSTLSAFQDALLGGLACAADPGPAVIVLEDLHWADQATLALLPSLADTLETAPLLIIGTYRREDLSRLHPLRRVRLELRRAGTLDELTLDALDAGATATLAAARLGAPLDAALAALVYERTEGVPLFTREFLDALHLSGRLIRGVDGRLSLGAGADVEVPRTLRDAVLLGLDRLSAAARAAAETAAVLGVTFNANHLLDLIGDDAAFDTLNEWGVIRLDGPQATFRHALIRDAIYAGIPWARRRTLHRQIAARLEVSAPPGQVADHWLAGQEPERARHALLAASSQSCRLHAYRDAAEAAGRALELWPAATDEPGRLEVLGQLGQCAQACGLLPEAARAWREVAQAHRDAGDPGSSAAAERRLAGALELQGLWEQALEARHAAAEGFAAAEQPGAAAEERLAVGTTLRATSRNAAALDVLGRALLEARQARRRDLEARILGQSGNARVRAGQIQTGLSEARAGLAIAVEEADMAATAEILQRIADSLEHAGEYAAARHAYMEAIDACAAGGLPDFACHACLAVPLYQNGDWARASAECRSVLAAPGASAVPRAVAGAMLGTVLAHRGQASRARPLLHGALASSRHLGLVPVQLRALWGLALLEEHAALSAATLWIRTMHDVWGASEDHYHILFPMRWAATVAARLERLDDLRRVVSTLSRAADLNGGPVAYSALAHALGELAWMEGELDAAASQFGVAARLLRDTSTPFEEASTRLRAGQVLAALGRLNEAASHLSWTYRTARTLKAKALTLSAAGALDTLGQPVSLDGVPSPLGLTRRQLEVLCQVALGRTDRAIAHELHLSPRTVEMHVGRILASLDSHTRAEAVGKAATLGLLTGSVPKVWSADGRPHP